MPALQLNSFGHGDPSIVVLSSHGGRPTQKLLDSLFPRSQHDLVSDYLAIEEDRGANEVARETARQIHQRTGLTIWELEVTVPRGLIDANRVLKRALRPVLPTNREQQIARLVSLHQQAQRTILDIVSTSPLAFQTVVMVAMSTLRGERSRAARSRQAHGIGM